MHASMCEEIKKICAFFNLDHKLELLSLLVWQGSAVYAYHV